MKNVLVVGSINMDLTIYTDKMPVLGETVTGTGFFSAFGGKGVNQAAALAKQGMNVKFIGAVGNDLNGEKCLKNLKDMGIEFLGKVIPDVSTGVASITVCNGNNCITLHEGANAFVNTDILESNHEAYEWADIVVMQLEIPVDTVVKSCKMAKQHNCIAVLNPAPVKELPYEIYKYTDIIIPNEHEAKSLTGIECNDEKSCEEAVCELKKRGVKSIIITLGENGCAYTENGSIIFKKAYKAKAVDTTAAGDSFIGGLCSELENTDELAGAVDYASKVSAITVSKPGASDSIPTRKEVSERFG